MNLKQPLISVVIPTYNVESYVDEAIESILNQTYKNIEIIIVDDFSTDNTFHILKKYEILDRRVRLYRNDSNRKITYSLNFAISKANGEYIVRMDGDDVSNLDRIEKQFDYLCIHPEIDLVGCSIVGINERGDEISKLKYYSDFNLLFKLKRYISPVLHIWMAKRRVYEVLNGYRDIPGVEDYDFLLRMINHGFKFSNIEDYYGYKVRVRRGNTQNSLGLLQRKSMSYVYFLYKQRGKGVISKDYDDFSYNVNSFQFRYYKFFNKILLYSLSIKKKNWVLSILILLLCILFSRYHRRYYENKIAIFLIVYLHSRKWKSQFSS